MPATILALAVAAPVPSDKAKPVEIDFADIYSTVKMNGLKQAEAKNEKKADNDMGVVMRAASRAGASNVFLVRGEDITDAVASTRALYGDGGRAGQPLVGADAPLADQIWVGAFLGNESTTPASFEIRRVELHEQTVRVVFSRPKEGGSSPDGAAYFVWAKLSR